MPIEKYESNGPANLDRKYIRKVAKAKISKPISFEPKVKPVKRFIKKTTEDGKVTL